MACTVMLLTADKLPRDDLDAGVLTEVRKRRGSMVRVGLFSADSRGRSSDHRSGYATTGPDTQPPVRIRNGPAD